MESKQVTLNDKHIALEAKMMPFAGFNMPLRYTSDIEEHMTVRQGVGVFDVSHMGEFMVTGPNAFDLIQWVSSNDASKLTPGKAQYSCLPNENGGIVDDLIVYMLDDQKYMLVVNASNIDKDFQWIESHNRFGADLQNISDEISLFAVQGPKATEALQPITEIDLDSIKFYHFVRGSIGGIDDVIISATGYTGAGGFELYVSNEHAEQLWDAVFESGSELGIKPVGLGARDTLRIEMGFCLYGNDIDDNTSPIEARLGWITKFTKPFISHEKLKRQKEEGIKKKLMGIEMVDKGIPRQGYSILNNTEESIGEITSGTMSPVLKKGIGLGYVLTDYAEPGTSVKIAVRNRTLKAVITRPPFI